MRNKTAHLSVDIKRTLLMVDGVSSIREISKRVAPSLRVSLGGIFKELLKEGYITVRQTAKVFNLPQTPSQAKTAAPTKMTMPTKLSIPILKSVDDGLNELDFASGFNSGVAEVSPNQLDTNDQALDEEKFRAEIKARVEAEFRDEIKARVEAELRAEAMAQEEAETKQRLLDEAKAIDEARALAEERARLEAKDQADAKIAAEEKARVAAEVKARAEAEAKAIAEEKARVAAEAKAIAEEKARVEAEAKAIAEKKARVEAEAKAIAEEKARVVAEAKARAEAEAQARAELEAKIRAEAKARAEAEAKAIAEEKARIEAEIRAEAKLRVEAETKKRMEEARQLAEAQARQEAEIKSLAAAQARAEAEVQAIAEAKARIEAEIRAEAKAQIAEENKIRKELELAGLKARFAADKLPKNDPLAIDVREKLLGLAHEDVAARKIHDSPHANQSDRVGEEEAKSKSVVNPTERSTSATVLFFDVVGYTKLSGNKQLEVKEQFNRLVSSCLEAQGEGERLILDTGDGAAIGFMQHPEDALEVAMQFRNTLIANQHNDYPELKVRIGIHIGPVTIVKDMNGQSNMVGDAINDAQRVMNFAGTDQIFISRAYHEFISRLNEQYGDIFYYQGAQKDKHNREHHVYKLVDVVSPATQSGKANVSDETAAVKLEPFSFDVDEEITKAVSGNKSAGKAIAQPIIESVQPLPDLPEPPANIQQEEVTPPAPETSVHSQSEINDLEKEQAKLWAEAEQEAIAAAEASFLRIQPQDEVPRPAINHRPRERREPIPWGKVVAGFLLVVLATLFVAPYVFPTRGFVSKIEKSLAAKLQQPVHVGGLEGRLLPVPRLDLLDISVGESSQIKVQRARANFSMLTLLSSSKVIKSLELQGAQINAVALQDVSVWLRHAVADKAYPILKIALSDSKLEGNGIQLHSVGGEFNFNKTGAFKAAKLYADGHKLELELDASSGKTKVSMSARASALPLLPGWVFDDFNAKGELTDGTLSIAEIESHIAKGILRGKARIDWRSGWSVEGSLAAKNIASQNLSGGVSGDVEGTARFQMRSTELAKLADAATMDGSLAMNQGVINGIDIVETASRRSTENLPGGRTHFDELWSDFSFANDAYNFRQLKIKAGVMTAKGTLDVSKQQLSGRITADMALRSDNMGVIPMQIGGSADNPTLKMVR